jgi:hypothetical protein
MVNHLLHVFRSWLQAIMHMYSAQKEFSKISHLTFVHNSRFLYVAMLPSTHPSL